jgi:hypothetical protein
MFLGDQLLKRRILPGNVLNCGKFFEKFEYSLIKWIRDFDGYEILMEIGRSHFLQYYSGVFGNWVERLRFFFLETRIAMMYEDWK